MSPRTRHGFSLAEILISLLILGLSLSGLLAFLRWGQMSYIQLTEGWQSRQFLNQVRLHVRRIVATRDLDFSSGAYHLLPERLPRGGVLKVQELSIKPGNRETCFATGIFYADLNRNGRQDRREQAIRQTWVFRRRAGV